MLSWWIEHWLQPQQIINKTLAKPPIFIKHSHTSQDMIGARVIE
jgi:hypothetical protein